MPVSKAFDQGQTPTIVCFNQSTIDISKWGVPSFAALVAALQSYLTAYFVPFWGTPGNLVVGAGFVKNCWAIQFLNDADQEGALAYHDLTPGGMPLSKVFVGTTLKAGEKVGPSASHELAEMMVDPAIQMCCTGPDPKAIYAFETADPVEDLSFKVNGIDMSDFVTPAYFESFRKAGSARFDYMNQVKRPFQILKGGYQSIYKGGRWTEVFAANARDAAAKKKSFMAEDRRGHRSEIRRSRPLIVTAAKPRTRKKK